MVPLATVSGVVRRHGLGLLTGDPALTRAKLTAEKVYSAVRSRDLPAKLDLRLKNFPVRDQGEQGACVAFSTMVIAQNLEHHDTTKLSEPLSPQYVYNLRSNYPEEGMFISDAMELLQKYGVVKEKTYPYGARIESKNEIPREVVQLGQKYKMGEIARIDSVSGLRKSMHTRQAGVLLTFKVYNYTKHFWRKQAGDELEGYHAVAAVGYDDERRRILIQNSWGKEWGDEGCTYMNYDEFEGHLHEEAVAFVDVKGSEPYPENADDGKQRSACGGCIIV